MNTAKICFRIVFVIISVMALMGCTFETKLKDQPEMSKLDQTFVDKKDVPKLKIKTSTIIEQCSQRTLRNKILYILSRHCPKCKRGRIVLENIIRSEGLESYYIPIDLSAHADRERLAAYNLEVQFVPTLIVDCVAYVGANHTQHYADIIKVFKYGR